MKNLKDFTIWFENLKKESLEEIGLFYDEDVFFKDPFNELVGKDKLIKIFEHMFENLENPRFFILDTIENSDGAFLTWDFLLSINFLIFSEFSDPPGSLNFTNLIFFFFKYFSTFLTCSVLPEPSMPSNTIIGFLDIAPN